MSYFSVLTFVYNFDTSGEICKTANIPTQTHRQVTHVTTQAVKEEGTKHLPSTLRLVTTTTV